MGPAHFVESEPETPILHSGSPPREPSLSYEGMSEDELAEKIRPVQLLGGYEYRLAEPDRLLARRIREMTVVPTTDAHAPQAMASQVDAAVPPVNLGAGQLEPLHIFPPDERINATWGSVYPMSATGHQFTTGGGCSTFLIGPTTGVIAAHCLYKYGWKTPVVAPNNQAPGGYSTGIAYGAYDSTGSSPTTPFSRWDEISVTVPNGWIATSNDWTWDFAIIEWAPVHNPGNYTGWLGTESSFDGYRYLYGYSGDKPICTSMFRGGTMAYVNSAEYVHYVDAIGGDSGGAFYNAAYRATCIQSAEHSYTDVWGNIHNENWCRRWDSATYNFFDAYAVNWP